MDHPNNTAAAATLDALLHLKEKPLLSELMSSRMAHCASILPPDEFIGWQMYVPTEGTVSMSVFGSGSIAAGDLEWIAERTGKVSPCDTSAVPVGEVLDELYELRLCTENDLRRTVVGFQPPGEQRGKETRTASRLPKYYSAQFAEMLRAFRQSGAFFRAVLGPAAPDEQEACRAASLRSRMPSSIPPEEYIGRPLRSRFLIRLPSRPSVRLLSVMDTAIPGAELRRIGSMQEGSAAQTWRDPLRQPIVLPDFAARIMLLEPTGSRMDGLIGIDVCEEPVTPIPASHKSAPEDGAVAIGTAIDLSGVQRTITIGGPDLRRHYQIVGQTGTGKSTLLASAILSAIEQGYGLTFFDPHGSTIDTVLHTLSETCADRVRVVRIGDTENPVPLNIWDSGDPIKEERNIADLCELFADIFDPKGEGIVGPRYERWLSTFAKAAIALLGRRASLESIAVISQSQDNMLKLSRAIHCRYPELVETIKQEYGTDRSSEFQNMLNWYLCKFQRLTSVEALRKALGAGANALDFGRSVDTNTVTLIDLAMPAIGPHAARIVGTLALQKLWNAILTRKHRERTHIVVLDECQLFQTNPLPRMLAESRKFGVSMILCHQHTGQLTQEIRDALEANTANFSAFRLSPRDAASAAVRFDDPEMHTKLARLDAYRAITTLSVNGMQTAPFTLETVLPPIQENADAIAARIEENSRRTLVEPYRQVRALLPSEIMSVLEDPGLLDELSADGHPVHLVRRDRHRSGLRDAG